MSRAVFVLLCVLSVPAVLCADALVPSAPWYGVALFGAELLFVFACALAAFIRFLPASLFVSRGDVVLVVDKARSSDPDVEENRRYQAWVVERTEGPQAKLRLLWCWSRTKDRWELYEKRRWMSSLGLFLNHTATGSDAARVANMLSVVKRGDAFWNPKCLRLTRAAAPRSGCNSDGGCVAEATRKSHACSGGPCADMAGGKACEHGATACVAAPHTPSQGAGVDKA